MNESTPPYICVLSKSGIAILNPWRYIYTHTHTHTHTHARTYLRERERERSLALKRLKSTPSALANDENQFFIFTNGKSRVAEPVHDSRISTSTF